MTLASLAYELLILLAVLSVLMSLFFLISKEIKNAGIVDVVWAASFGTIALISAAVGDASFERRVILLLAIVPWSLRMAIHLLLRFLKEHPHEDKRYASLRLEWGAKANWMMFLVFLFQGLLICVLSAPFLLIASNTSSNLHLSELIGAAICTVGMIGEAIADEQLSRFKSNAGNRGKVCMTGLWNYSRHPNYFFEFIVWVGIFIMASTAPFGMATIYCPLLMLYLLTQMTGVKISEQQSLKSRGEEYKNYQASTSAFFPWFKKSKQR